MQRGRDDVSAVAPPDVFCSNERHQRVKEYTCYTYLFHYEHVADETISSTISKTKNPFKDP